MEIFADLLQDVISLSAKFNLTNCENFRWLHSDYTDCNQIKITQIRINPL